MGEKLADLLCRIVIIRLTERRPDGYPPPHSLLPSFLSPHQRRPPAPFAVEWLSPSLSVSPLSSLALSEGDLPFPSLQEVGSEGAERGRREPDADVGRKEGRTRCGGPALKSRHFLGLEWNSGCQGFPGRPQHIALISIGWLLLTGQVGIAQVWRVS